MTDKETIKDNKTRWYEAYKWHGTKNRLRGENQKRRFNVLLKEIFISPDTAFSIIFLKYFLFGLYLRNAPQEIV